MIYYDPYHERIVEPDQRVHSCATYVAMSQRTLLMSEFHLCGVNNEHHYKEKARADL